MSSVQSLTLDSIWRRSLTNLRPSRFVQGPRTLFQGKYCVAWNAKAGVGPCFLYSLPSRFPRRKPSPFNKVSGFKFRFPRRRPSPFNESLGCQSRFPRRVPIHLNLALGSFLSFFLENRKRWPAFWSRLLESVLSVGCSDSILEKSWPQTGSIPSSLGDIYMGSSIINCYIMEKYEQNVFARLIFPAHIDCVPFLVLKHALVQTLHTR